jgi:ABC-2 type transport system ATP-binding protein
MIVFRNLTKKFKEVTAVSNLSFEIKEQEIFGLLGPNGAGKTTTLLMLASVLKPTGGTVIVDGFDVCEEPHKVRERLGLSFQEPVLDFRLSVEKNLDFHAEACGIPKDKRKELIREILEYLEMWQDRKKKAGKLSGGMKKKVEDAKLFIQKPKIAIFDEPTAYLDPPSRHKIWKRIKQLRDEGSTIILATNAMDEADLISDRVAIINKGKLVALNTPSKLKGTIPGGEVIEIKVEGRIEHLKSAVKGFSDVADVATVKGANIARIYVNHAEKALPLIMEKLFEQKMKVTGVDLKKPSLDDVFLHYTGALIE